MKRILLGLSCSLVVFACGEEKVSVAQGEIAFSVNQLDFGSPLIGSKIVRTVDIISEGNGPVNVSRLSLEEADPAREFTSLPAEGPLELVLKSHEQFTITVTLTPNDSQADLGRLCVDSNDPDDPVTCVELVSSNAGVAQLCACVLDIAQEDPLADCDPSVERVIFHDAALGQSDSRVVALHNCGSPNQPLAIESKNDIYVTGHTASLKVKPFADQLLSTQQTFPLVMQPPGNDQDGLPIPTRAIFAEVELTPVVLGPMPGAELCVDYRDQGGSKTACLEIDIDPVVCAQGTADLDGAAANGCECVVSPEVCDRADNDCNGLVDDVDSDTDSYFGCPGLPERDCNDQDPGIYPAAAEVCDGVDQNCNSFVDEGVQTLLFRDVDQDQYGDPAAQLWACQAPDQTWIPLLSMTGFDCNDANVDIHPGTQESCNGADDDCNGLVDDRLPLVLGYRDQDGDGFAPTGAVGYPFCKTPAGYAVARDPDGDGKTEWDCNDTDAVVFPTAAEVCDDGKDNDCDGAVDRTCFTPCAGSWPYRLAYSGGGGPVGTADLDGDGQHEVLVSDTFGFAILDSRGAPLYEYSAPSYNYARNGPVLADIDDYQTFGTGIQTLEVLTGNNSRARFYKLNPAGQSPRVTLYEDTDPLVATPPYSSQVFDGSAFMAADLDHDGQVEFFTSTWCKAEGARIFRFDKTTKRLSKVGGIDDADSGKCQYSDGRALVDLDGDRVLEFVYGNGYYGAGEWSGQVHAVKFTDLVTLANQPYCPGCYSNALGDFFPTYATSHVPVTVRAFYAMGTEIRAEIPYNNVALSTGGGTWYWRYGQDGNAVEAPKVDNRSLGHYPGTTDLDRDGVSENLGEVVATSGAYDVTGDGLPDRIDGGNELRLFRYDKAAQGFQEVKSARRTISGFPVERRAIWDINADGRLDVLSTDTLGYVYCHQLGPRTWDKSAMVPPHFPLHQRTFQWDNYEPNEGESTDADGMPLDVAAVPSALTAKGDFYAYLSSATDKDYYQVDTAWGGSSICLTAPLGSNLILKVYAAGDKFDNSTRSGSADGKKDGLIFTSAATSTAAQSRCFAGNSVSPARNAEFKFVVGVEVAPAGAWTAHWPYWLYIRK